MSWIDWKTRKQLRIEAENAAWAKYEKSLTELNERMNRRLVQQVANFEVAAQKILEATQATIATAVDNIEAGFQTISAQWVKNHTEEIAWYQAEMQKLKDAHVKQNELKDAQLQVKFDEVARTKARLDESITAYETGYAEAMKLSQRLGLIAASLDQKSYNDKMQASKNQADAKDAAISIQHVQETLLPQIQKGIDKKAANKEPL